MIRFLVQLLGLSIVLTAITLILMAFKGVMRKKITAYCRCADKYSRSAAAY